MANNQKLASIKKKLGKEDTLGIGIDQLVTTAKQIKEDRKEKPFSPEYLKNRRLDD